MRENINNLWPTPHQTKKKLLQKKINIKQNKKKLKKIENFFTKQFGYKSKLFPSGRACLGVIIRYLNLNKDKYIYVNKWSSNSLISSIGHFCNISSNINQSDLILNNNQWGKKNYLKYRNKQIIEDSCDSIILNYKLHSLDRSKFEFFSLPKIIGSYSGGIVISKDEKFLTFCKSEQKKNIEFGESQFKSKLSVNKRNYLQTTNFWFNEVNNTYCDYYCLEDIDKNLKYYEYNKLKIMKRLEFLKKKFNFKINNRIGPVFPISIKRFKNLKNIKNKFLIRNRIIKEDMSKFEKCILLPIHFRINDYQFKYLFNLILKNLKV